MFQVMRRSVVVVFWAFLLFALAYLALGRITDPRAPFDGVARSHQEVNLAFTVLAYGGYLVLLAILVAGLPMLFQAVKLALVAGPRGVRRLFRLRLKWLLWLLGVAFCCAVLLPGTIIGTELLFGGPPSATGQPTTAPGWLLAGLALVGAILLVMFVLLVLAAAFSAAVMRSTFGPKLLAFVRVILVVGALSMGVTTGATIVWIVRFQTDAPQIALNADVLGGVGLSWVIVVIVAMSVATIAALFAAFSNFKRIALPS